MSNPRIGLDADGTLDDFMARDVDMVHFEALSESRWYATIRLSDGRVFQLNYGARNETARLRTRGTSPMSDDCALCDHPDTSHDPWNGCTALDDYGYVCDCPGFEGPEERRTPDERSAETDRPGVGRAHPSAA